tara:strand:- start:231 stop:1691 length:1461 start_codon:yes stop_codon:yes gene_type:complete
MYNFNLTKKINLICILSIFFSCSNNETVGLENNDTILNGQWILNPAKKSSQKIVNISSEKVTSFINSNNNVCNIHSVIFYEDFSFKLYTLDDNGICNYVIFGSYTFNKSIAEVLMYVSIDGSDTLIGKINDLVVSGGYGDANSLKGTFNFDNLCVSLENGYRSQSYTEALTYIPDDNLEKYLIDINVDDIMDDYILTSNAINVSNFSPDAEDKWVDGGSIDFYDFDSRFFNRLTNLAGIEALPNLTEINLRGHKLDSINISKNKSLITFYANFNSFKNLNTSGNENLENFAIDNNTVVPKLDFSNNNSLVSLAIPNIPAGGSIGGGENSYIDISNLISLEFLDIPSCNFTSVDLSNNIELIELRASFNKLEKIDLKNNNKLKKLYLAGNNLTEIEIQNLVDLEEMFIYSNQLKKLDLTKNIKLQSLHIHGNKLEGVFDVSMIENLKELEIERNPSLTCLKVSQDQLDNNVSSWKIDSNLNVVLNCN